MIQQIALQSPIGPVTLRWDKETDLLIEIRLGHSPPRGKPLDAPRLPSAWVRELADQLRRYFAGEIVRFSGDHLVLDRHAPFTRRVYEQVATIPSGETRTYAQIAAAAGSPRAARAVGNAMARNPYPLVIPCHRVLAANGLGGFGSGLDKKRWLLRHEGTDPAFR